MISVVLRWPLQFICLIASGISVYLGAQVLKAGVVLADLPGMY